MARFFLLFAILLNTIPHAMIEPRPRPQAEKYKVSKIQADKSDITTKELKDVTPIQPRGAGQPPREAEPVRLIEIQRTVGGNAPAGASASSTTSAPAPPRAFAQNAPGPKPSTELLSSFDGISNGTQFTYNPNKFRVRLSPPDTNGAVGEDYYVQWVNASLAIFEKKTGKLIYGPVQGKTLWQAFDKDACENNNDGDPIVQYDKINKRWILAQFAVSNFPEPELQPTTTIAHPPFYQCLAVSESSNPLGKYRRFRFSYPYFNDYPKLGVWTDAYYTTFNMIGSDQHFVGALVCAYDKDVMLGRNTERPATQQCVQLKSKYLSLLPADIDGTSLPAPGTPNYLLNLDPNAAAINLWKFHVDWKDSANSSLEGPTVISGVEAFAIPCLSDPTRRLACIEQQGTTQVLESSSDRLMYRLAYRRFADHEALVFNHAVATNSGGSAIRWYELRNPFDTPAIYQSGTFAPDSNSRWIGSIAMDKVGNIGIGYSISGSNMFPSIYFTGHDVTDLQKGRLQEETPIVKGGGSQRCRLSNDTCSEGCLLSDGTCVSSVARWGDYSSLSLDPLDDCTMWYTTEYIKVDGGFNWSTKVARFKFKSCK